MSQLNDRSGGLGHPTSVRVGEIRGRIVRDALLAEPVAHVDEIAGLPRLAGWRSDITAAAVDVLVAEGRIEEDATGRLLVHSRGPK